MNDTQAEIDAKYEVDDIDHALATHNLRNDAAKAQARATKMKAFYDWLEAHPDFKTFYNLMKASERY